MSTKASQEAVPPAAAEPRSRARNRWRDFVTGAGVIVLLVLAVYAPVLRGGFVWDDTILVERNPLVKGEANLRTIWFAADFPLTTVVIWLQWLVWGKNAAGYHVVNVLLHAASAVLLWRVLARLRIPGDWLAAILFAVHPVCVASAGWISEQKNTLSLLFYLVSIGCYLRFTERSPRSDEPNTSDDSDCATQSLPPCSKNPEIGRVTPCAPELVEGGGAHGVARPTPTAQSEDHPLPIDCGEGQGEGQPVAARPSPMEIANKAVRAPARSRYWLSLLAFLLALLSKTSTVMLPVILLACAWWQRGRITRRDVLRTSPFFALALAFGLMTIWFQAHQVYANVEVQSENFWGRLAGAGMVFWFYLGKALLPVNLSMIYPRWEIDAVAPLSYLPLLLLGGAIAACWWFRGGWGRHALFALGCFVASLFPVLGFFDMYFLVNSRVSDHFQYLALIPVLALVAAVASSKLNAKVLMVAGSVLVLALLVLTVQRARVFATDEGLWRDTLAKNSAAWTAHNNLACILAEQQKLDEAMEHFEASLKIYPRNSSAHCNLGRALMLKGRPAEAEAHFLTSLEIQPDAAETRNFYAQLLARTGRSEEALAQLRELNRIKPGSESRLQLAQFLAATGRKGEAMAEYRQVLARAPDSVEALNNLAWMLATSWDGNVRNGSEAVQLAERACRLTEHKDARMLGALAAAYAEAGRFPDAVATAQKAIEMANTSGNAQFAAINQQLLQLYGAGRPYHEPPPKTVQPGRE